MSPNTAAEPVALAQHVAATAHDLALAARPTITPLRITDIYAITGALDDLVAALAQTLAQLNGYLPTGTDHAALAADQLRRARASAHHLAVAIDAAHQTLGDLAEQPETEPRGSIFNRR